MLAERSPLARGGVRLLRKGAEDGRAQGRFGGPAVTEPGEAAWIDVSVTVRHGMPHWPDNPPIVMQRSMDIGQGHACNLSHLAMGVHSGTHIDGPLHFIHQAAGASRSSCTAATERPPGPSCGPSLKVSRRGI